jgi:hypothetical protein
MAARFIRRRARWLRVRLAVDAEGAEAAVCRWFSVSLAAAFPTSPPPFPFRSPFALTLRRCPLGWKRGVLLG